jgi:cytochrome P450
MTFCLFEMAHQPALLERVRREVEALLPDGGAELSESSFEALRDEAPLLNACIFEALRLWPPVPSGLQRTTTTDGMVLPGGMVVPHGTVRATVGEAHRLASDTLAPGGEHAYMDDAPRRTQLLPAGALCARALAEPDRRAQC